MNDAKGGSAGGSTYPSSEPPASSPPSALPAPSVPPAPSTAPAAHTGSEPADAEPWHVDSSVPASDALSDLGEAPSDPDENIAEPDPIDYGGEDGDEDDGFSEAITEIPGLRARDRDSGPSGQTGGGSKDRRRSQTIARKQMLRDRRRMIATGGLPEVLEYERPRHRSDCRGGKRPCLYVACRYHLFLDVNPITGSIKINFPDVEVWQLEETCALDVAERGGITLEEVGEIMNLTRERIRQVEASGLGKLRTGEVSLSAFLDGEGIEVGGPGTLGHQRLPVLDD